MSVWFVDSAVRWRRKGAGGLIRNSCLRTVVRSPFFVVLRFRNSQNCAGRCLPTRKLAASAVAGLTPAGCVRSVQEECTLFKFASSASVGAVLFSCRSPRGEFCEPPQGGASARTAEAGLYFYKPQPPEHLFPPPFRVAASCIFQSAAELGTIQNAKFTIHNYGKHAPHCGYFSGAEEPMPRLQPLRPGPARIGDATPAAGPGEHTKNEYCRLIDSSASPQNDNGGIELSKRIY